MGDEVKDRDRDPESVNLHVALDGPITLNVVHSTDQDIINKLDQVLLNQAAQQKIIDDIATRIDLHFAGLASKQQMDLNDPPKHPNPFTK